MIRNILFDIGNVLLSFDLDPAVEKLNHRQDLDTAGARKRVEHRRNPLESGHCGENEFLRAVKQDLAFPGTTYEVRALYEDIFQPVPHTWSLAESLAARGFRLILFSNISSIHSRFIRLRYPVFRHFPEAIYSYEVGDMKPGPGMYRHATDTLGLTPEKTFYIDDLAANIETGRRFGFRCHLYDHHRPQDLDEQLESLGISVRP